MSASNDRSDVAKRRARLRWLDIALCDELEDAGAQTFQALRDEVIGRDLLRAAVSDETLWEWWHYARRRRIVEPAQTSGEMELSERGRARLQEARRAHALPNAPKARAIVRYLVPPGIATGLVVATVGVLNEEPVVALGVGAALLIVVIYWFIAEAMDKVFAKWVDPRFLAATLRSTVAWLDGDQIRWIGRTRLDAVDKTTIARLDAPPLPLLAPSKEARAETTNGQPAAVAGSAARAALRSSTD